MTNQRESHKRVRWMPGIFITSGIVLVLVSFLLYVFKEATFAPSLGNYVAVKNPTADVGLILILGTCIVIGVILISVGIFTWGKE